MEYQDINAETIDRWVEAGWEWGKPISHEQYADAVNGVWDVFLTPTKPVPHEWLGECGIGCDTVDKVASLSFKLNTCGSSMRMNTKSLMKLLTVAATLNGFHHDIFGSHVGYF